MSPPQEETTLKLSLKQKGCVTEQCLYLSKMIWQKLLILLLRIEALGLFGTFTICSFPTRHDCIFMSFVFFD